MNTVSVQPVMERVGRKKVRSDAILNRIVLITSLVCFVVNGSILVVSCASGQWVFGHAFCQIYGLVGQVLVAGSAWMVALFALERGYRVLLPVEYVFTFSEINLRILVYGVYLVLLVMYTAPLYGWGEYSNYRGAIHLKMDIFPGNNTSCIDDMNYNDIYQNASIATNLVLRREYSSDIRFRMPDRVMVTRFPTRTQLHMFSMEYSSGVFERRVRDVFSKSITQCNVTCENISFRFERPSQVFKVYSDVHIPFQEIGICSLDFSPVNSNISSWIPFSVIIATVLPYGIAAVLGLILHRISRKIGERYPYAPLSIVIGSVAGLVSTLPYYIVNIYNNKEIFVNHAINVASTMLCYSSALWYVICATAFEYLRVHYFQTRGDQSSSEVSMENFSCHSKVIVYKK